MFIVTDILIESGEDSSIEAVKYGPIAQVMQNTYVIYTDKTVQEIKDMDRKFKAYKMDVTNQEQVKEVLAQVKEEFGMIDILINNAGTFDHVSQIEQQNDDFKVWL